MIKSQMTPRSAAEQCQIDCDEYRKEEPSCYGYDFGNAWRKGHAAGRAEAEELVEAAERALKFGFVSVERKGELRNTHSDLTRALARFKAVKGE